MYCPHFEHKIRERTPGDSADISCNDRRLKAGTAFLFSSNTLLMLIGILPTEGFLSRTGPVYDKGTSWSLSYMT